MYLLTGEQRNWRSAGQSSESADKDSFIKVGIIWLPSMIILPAWCNSIVLKATRDLFQARWYRDRRTEAL